MVKVKVKDKHSRGAWLVLSAEWSRSGLQQKQFCNQRGIDYRAFVNWRNRNKAAIAEADDITYIRKYLKANNHDPKPFT